jgi:SNF2 family DNA or RNA helicase
MMDIASLPISLSARLFDKTRSMIRGAILANDVGMGKTLTTALTIIMHYNHCVRVKAQGKSCRPGPVIWLTQANQPGCPNL